jgi:aspartyl-tRNA(Asn)/glutamyl-tRNA(Gln) amidotransferase subunit A
MRSAQLPIWTSRTSARLGSSSQIGMTDLIELTIQEAGALLRRRAISSTDLVAASLARIEETEPVLHAYATVLAESAREEAKQADKELAAGNWRGRLHGIPIGVKDLFYTRGVPTEAGSRVLAGFVPTYDATAVRRLREAGAVVLGKTVTNEFAYGLNVPPTRNPWNLGYYPGGSSAGSGVATAVGAAFGAIGTDTGGSIRVPAAINGLAGLKPTLGLVSRHGVVPLSTSMDHAGPMARTVEDCALMLQALAGFDPLDPGSLDRQVPDYTAGLEGGAKGARLGVDHNYFFGNGVAPDVRAAVETALHQLEGLGAEIVEVSIPELELAAIVGLTILQVEGSVHHLPFLRSQSADYEVGTRLILELGALIPSTQYVLSLKARTVIAAAVRNTFQSEQLTALASPTLPIPSVRLEQMAVDFLGGGEGADLSGLIRHGAVANVTGLPALTVPCGLSSDEMPVGLQLMGRPFAEASLFQIAWAYEAATNWHMLRPDFARLQVEGVASGV